MHICTIYLSAYIHRNVVYRHAVVWIFCNNSYLNWGHPTPVLLSGKSHGRRSLVSCSPWGHYKSDTTERLPFHFSLSCIGEGNGNLLQCSCLENPRDGGAWWAAIYGVAQSRTRLTWLSSSNHMEKIIYINISQWFYRILCFSDYEIVFYYFLDIESLNQILYKILKYMLYF